MRRPFNMGLHTASKLSQVQFPYANILQALPFLLFFHNDSSYTRSSNDESSTGIRQ